MKQLWYRFQLLLIATACGATLVMAYLMIQKIDVHYDFTKDKTFSLPGETAQMLEKLKDQRVEVLIFFPKDDPSRDALEVFFSQCQNHHDDFHYNIYDPIRKPKMAEKYGVTQNYMTIVRAGEDEQRLTDLSEATFTNALFRLAHPHEIQACFVTGHNELELDRDDHTGLSLFRETLENYNVKLENIVLSRDGVPEVCKVVVVAGPRWEYASIDYLKLKEAFAAGKSLWFLIDPMDLGSGKKFVNFLKKYGVLLGENVIVDKESRVVGGDFLMPLVNQYPGQAITSRLQEATFFPIARTVQPYVDGPETLEVLPLAMTGDGSWAETDLVLLEEGKASFEFEHDVAGPLPLGVTVEGVDPKEYPGRIVVMGDSDFLTNGYLSLSGNEKLALETVKWLARDERFVDVKVQRTAFVPLILDEKTRMAFLAIILFLYPLIFVAIGGIYLIVRSRTS